MLAEECFAVDSDDRKRGNGADGLECRDVQLCVPSRTPAISSRWRVSELALRRPSCSPLPRSSRHSNNASVVEHLVRTWRIVLDPQAIVAVLVHHGVQLVVIGASGRAKDLEHLDRYHEGKD